METLNGAALAVKCLTEQKVKYILGIPGAKIDTVFDALLDGGPELIVCRHEQNAAFIAAAIGRLSGQPGVCLVTSGPGTSNLATGLVTATTEGDPVVAIGGAVGRSDEPKRTHQSMKAISLMEPVTKYAMQAESAESIPEILNNAFRIANTPRKGATFIGLPMDVQHEVVNVKPYAIAPPKSGPADYSDIKKTAELISQAKLPVILLGACASVPKTTASLRKLLENTTIPVVETFQSAGALSRELRRCTAGRVGLFRNQPGDLLLAEADLILTVGYDPVEYDPGLWNPVSHCPIIHLSEIPAEIDNHYQPEIELIGDPASTLELLATYLPIKGIESYSAALPFFNAYNQILGNYIEPILNLVHPIQFIQTLRKLIGDDVTVTVDMGSNFIWMSRHFECFSPRRLMVSNGQQTLGVGLPWGIGACLVNPHEKVVSISGDGGFLFSAMELETAVRLKLNLVHFVWNDGTYNMVAFQEEMKYGRVSGVDFGPIDTVKFAESFGAVGLRVTSPADLESTIKKAFAIAGPVVVEVPMDYSHNIHFGDSLHINYFH